jgi:hypothetical protein
MEKGNSSEKGSITNIRFNILYPVCVIIIAILLTVIFIRVKEKDWYNYIPLLVFALLFIIQAIYSLTGGKYVGLDKQNKKVIIYGLFGIAVRKYKYDRLFFKGKELYREIDGKTKFINIMRSQCRKDDLEAFVVEVNKGV